jgi:hypothetical protein
MLIPIYGLIDMDSEKIGYIPTNWRGYSEFSGATRNNNNKVETK